jgi:hypothetical protein
MHHSLIFRLHRTGSFFKRILPRILLFLPLAWLTLACARHEGAGARSPAAFRESDSSGLPFKTGINAHREKEWKRWAEWAGRPVDVVTVFTSRNGGWPGITEATWEFDNLASFTGKMDFAIPLFPDGSGNLADCAAGRYDAYWKQFAQLLVDHRRGDAYIRPAWEFNGNWFEGNKATDSALWIQAFRRVVSAIRSVAPAVKIEWVMNAHGSSPGCPPGGNAWSVYPGDDYVDIIGIDSYDMYPPSHNDAEWNAQCNGIHGICHVIEEARAHHKKFCVPEWGVSNKLPNGGGDNPYFISKMFDLFSANADVLEYEAYFNDSAPDNVRSELYDVQDDRPTQINPLSAARYLTLFGGKH